MVVIVVLGGGYWLWSTREAQAPSMSQGAGDENTPSMSSPSDTSDAGLDQDTAAIDAQINAASTDSATVNSTVNDQPVEQ